MNFNILYANHNPPIACEDMLRLVRLNIEAAGHTARYSDSIDGDAMNIIMESFETPSMASALDAVRSYGLKYIIVATEMITGNTFNRFDFNGVEHYANLVMWQRRYSAFLEWAKTAEAIWLATSDPAQLDLYRQVTGKRVVEIRPAWFESFRPVPNAEVQGIDFCFSGSRTTHRTSILGQLLHVGKTQFLSPHTPQYAREDYISRSRFCLDLRLCPDYGQLSQMRVWYLLQNGCHVIAEKPAMEARLGKYVMLAPSGELVETCRAALQNPSCSIWFERQLQAFREETHAKAEAERLIQETFA